MSLIQPEKFRTWETGLFKMPHLETPQTAVKVTVAFGHFLVFIKTYLSYLHHYFDYHVCLSVRFPSVRPSGVTKIFFRLNRLGIPP